MNSKWVIRKGDILSNIFVFLMCIPPSFAERMGVVASIYKYTKWLALFYALGILLKKRGRLEKIDIAVYAWFAWTAITVLINHTGLYDWFSKYYPYFTVYILSRYRLKRNAKDYIKLLTWIFMLLILGNYISWIMPGTRSVDELGEPLYLIGIRTRISDIIFIGIAITIIAVLQNRMQLKWKIFFGIIVLTGVGFSIGEWVSTSIVGLLLMLGLFIVSIRKKIDYRKFQIPLIIFALICFFLVVFVQIQNYFAWFIESFLGEDASLTGRTIIWESLIRQMKGVHWIWGNGLGNNIGFTISTRLTSAAHSQYLQIIYNHGILGLAFFSVIPIISIRKLSEFTTVEVCKYLNMALIALLITGITEITCDTSYFYIFLALIATMDRISEYVIRQ